MFTKVELLSQESDGVILAVTARTGVENKGSQSSAHRSGRVEFHNASNTIHFKNTDPLPMPDGLSLKEGQKVTFHLFAEDGQPMPNKARVATLVPLMVRPDKKSPFAPDPNVLVVRGESTQSTPIPEGLERSYKAFPFRAYFSHDGIETSKTLPDWLISAIRRNEAAWNALAEEFAAILKSVVALPAAVYIEKLINFREDTIIPALTAYNNSLGRKKAKEKIALPKYLRRRLMKVDNDTNPHAEPVATNEHLNLWLFKKFAYRLGKRKEEGRSIPEWEGKPLTDLMEEWFKAFPIDWTPLNALRKSENYSALVKSIADRHRLTFQEKASLLEKTRTIFENQTAKKMGPGKGWPQVRILPFDKDMRKLDWSISFASTAPGINVSDLYNPMRYGTSRNGEKVGLHLSFGMPVSGKDSGHPDIRLNAKGEESRRMKMALVPATISLPRYNEDGKDGPLTVAVLLHTPFPKDANFTKWTLKNHNGQLRLSVATKILTEVPASQEEQVMAGIDIGWRKIGDALRIATVYNPATETHFFATLGLDEQRGIQPECGPTERRRLHYPVGKSAHWTRQTSRNRDRKLIAEGRSVEGELASLRHAHEVLLKSAKPSVFQDEQETYGEWLENVQTLFVRNDTAVSVAGPAYDRAVRASLGVFNCLLRSGEQVEAYADVYSQLLRASKMFTFEDSLDALDSIRRHRDLLKDGAKEVARLLMGDECPTWWTNVGARGMKERAAGKDTQPAIRSFLNVWAETDDLFSSNLTEISGRAARRMEEAHHNLAHDICKELTGKVSGIMVEKGFLAKLAESKSNDDAPSLKKSRNTRHRAALRKFVDVLESTAKKYNLLWSEAPAVDSTRIHFSCGTNNGKHEELSYVCSGCGQTVEQDVNAAINLSRMEASTKALAK